MNADHPLARFLDEASNAGPLRPLKGLAAATLLYPLAERLERREVRGKVAELRRHYRLSAEARRQVARDRLADLVGFAGASVPYYRDLFARLGFDPEKLRADPRRLEALPLLTKDIINDEADRLFSAPLGETRHHACKTGGSTGRSATIYYDQPAADYSSAVTAWARARIGAARWRPALHFAARFPADPPERWPSRESFKTLAMNRSNIFFDRLDPAGIEDILALLRLRRPYLVHGHPSTLATIAAYCLDRYGPATGRPLFAVFESSGELLDVRQRQAIASAFGCRVVDRYGLAEFGIIAYQFDASDDRLSLLDSECWAESLPFETGAPAERLVVTGLRNRLMPLIRYDTGDLARVVKTPGGAMLEQLVGRIHDIVPINGTPHLSHHVQDVLDHRVGGIREFQVDLRGSPPILRLVLEPGASRDDVAARIESHWPGAFALHFVGPTELVRIGDRAKFRHVVQA